MKSVSEDASNPDPEFAKLLARNPEDKRVEFWLHLIRSEFGCTSVVEFGCGCGNLAIPLAKSGAYVLAVDRDPYSISMLGAVCRKNLEVQLGDFRAFKTNRKFDAAILRSCLPNYIEDEDILRFFQTSRSMIQKAGKVFVEVYQEKWLARRGIFSNEFQSFEFKPLSSETTALRTIYHFPDEDYQVDYVLCRRSKGQLSSLARAAGLALDARTIVTNPLSELLILSPADVPVEAAIAPQA
jgi:SAM-dependent methyltransferase